MSGSAVWIQNCTVERQKNILIHASSQRRSNQSYIVLLKMLSSEILTFQGWTSLRLSGNRFQHILCFVFWLGQELPARARQLAAVPGHVLARGMSHTCALMSLSLTDQLSCALLSFSIPCEPACQFPREATLCSPAVQCHFLFAFLSSFSFPVTHKCLLLTSVSCHNRARDCLQIKSRFGNVLGGGP